MATHRWHIELVEEPEAMLPVLWQPAQAPEEIAPAQQERTLLSLLAALQRLGRRGEGRQAWAPALVDDPMAFLLDATADYINVWGPGGTLLYSNHATAELQLGPANARVERVTVGDRQLERRSLPFSLFEATYLLEVAHEVSR